MPGAVLRALGRGIRSGGLERRRRLVFPAQLQQRDRVPVTGVRQAHAPASPPCLHRGARIDRRLRERAAPVARLGAAEEGVGGGRRIAGGPGVPERRICDFLSRPDRVGPQDTAGRDAEAERDALLGEHLPVRDGAQGELSGEVVRPRVDVGQGELDEDLPVRGALWFARVRLPCARDQLGEVGRRGRAGQGAHRQMTRREGGAERMLGVLSELLAASPEGVGGVVGSTGRVEDQAEAELKARPLRGVRHELERLGNAPRSAIVACGGFGLTQGRQDRAAPRSRGGLGERSTQAGCGLVRGTTGKGGPRCQLELLGDGRVATRLRREQVVADRLVLTVFLGELGGAG